MTPEELEALACQPEAVPVRRTKERTPKRVMLQWLRVWGIVPGDRRGVESSTLWAMYLTWPERPDPDRLTASAFGYLLKRLGFHKGRERVNYRDTRPVLMADAPAKAVRAWAKSNPVAPAIRQLFNGGSYGGGGITLEERAARGKWPKANRGGAAPDLPADAGDEHGGRGAVALGDPDGDGRGQGDPPQAGGASGGA